MVCCIFEVFHSQTNLPSILPSAYTVHQFHQDNQLWTLLEQGITVSWTLSGPTSISSRIAGGSVELEFCTVRIQNERELILLQLFVVNEFSASELFFC